MKQTPHESAEQTAVFQWAAYRTGVYPELDLLYHVPNGGSRNHIEAARLKAQGVKAGVPDLVLPVARGKHHGLYIELKRQKGGRLSDDQKKWLDELTEQGYLAVRCDGSEAAIKTIEDYLRGRL